MIIKDLNFLIDSQVSFKNKKILEETFLIQETYYGKNESLLEIERLFGALKSKGTFTNMNKAPEVERIKKIIEDLFGFEKVNLKIHPSESMNAFTVPFSWEQTYDDSFFELEKTSNGIRFKNPRGKTLNVFLHTYTIKDLSPEETTAILLHEIGHNFFLVDEQTKFVKTKIVLFQLIELLMALINAASSGDPRQISTVIQNALGICMTLISPSFAVKIQSFFKTITPLYQINQVSVKIGRAISTIVSFLANIVAIPAVPILGLLFLLMLPGVFLSGIIKLVISKLMFKSYDAERFSDSFATSYGYGKGVAKAFAKSNLSPEEAMANIPVIGFFNALLQAFIHSVLSFGMPYPSRIKRAENSLNQLKYELNNNKKDLTKKQIMDIEEDISKIENLLNNIESNVPKLTKMFDDMFGMSDTSKDFGAELSDREIFNYEKTILAKFFNIKK
jgi:hypothetical protein